MPAKILAVSSALSRPSPCGVSLSGVDHLTAPAFTLMSRRAVTKLLQYLLKVGGYGAAQNKCTYKRICARVHPLYHWSLRSASLIWSCSIVVTFLPLFCPNHNMSLHLRVVLIGLPAALVFNNQAAFGFERKKRIFPAQGQIYLHNVT